MGNRNRQNSYLIIIVLFLLVIDIFLLYMLNQTKRERTKREQEVKKGIKEKAEKKYEEALKHEEIKPQIAIVIDDLGYNLSRGERLLHIDFPFTVSILPNLPHSRNIAEKANKLGKEVILHLPMEPHDRAHRALEKETLLVSMSNSQIIKLINKDLENVIGAVGVNNHQGSKMIEDEEKMEVILGELRKRGLFFWIVVPHQRMLLEKLHGKLV